jgi:hypothetical protein
MKGVIETTPYGVRKISVAVVNGEPVAAPKDAVAYKYADPIEDARWLINDDEVIEIKREDPSLVVPVEVSFEVWQEWWGKKVAGPFATREEAQAECVRQKRANS